MGRPARSVPPTQSGQSRKGPSIDGGGGISYFALLPPQSAVATRSSEANVGQASHSIIHALRMLKFRKTKLRRGNEGWGQPASSLKWVCRSRQAHCTALPDKVREEMKSCLFATKVKSNNIDVIYKNAKETY